MKTAAAKRQGRQRCTKCGQPSIPGLRRGHGKCQYHWNVGAYGQEWADKRHETRIAEQTERMTTDETND